MTVMIVSYELRNPGKNYQPLYDYLNKFAHCHSHTSCWFIETTLTIAVVRDRLSALVDGNDTIFVARLSYEWAGTNLPCGNWLNAPGRSM